MSEINFVGKTQYEDLTETALNLINGQTINEVDDAGYKYLGNLELDKFKEREIKDIFKQST